MLQGRQHRSHGGIAHFDERFDRRCDGLRIRVLQEAPEELHGTGFRDLGEHVRELAERGTSDGEADQCALDPEGDFLEPIVGEPLERFTCGVARLGIPLRQHVDEEVDDVGAVQITQQGRDAHEAQRAFLVVLQHASRVRFLAKRRDERVEIGAPLFIRAHSGKLSVDLARSPFGVEERGEKRGESVRAVGHGGFDDVPKPSVASQEYARGATRYDGVAVRFARFSSILPAAALVGLSFATFGTARAHREPIHISLTPVESNVAAPLWAPCPPGTFPDGDACVHLPGGLRPSEDALSAENAHRERSGRWTVYEQIPRRPDRPASYDDYRYPVPPGLPGGHFVVSGYDLDRPDESQRRGRALHAVGHGGVDLPNPRGTPVTLVALENQVGDADVVYVGPLFGTTVVTRHTVREGARLRDYVLLYGHLDAPAPGLVAGRTVKEGEVLGFVGDTGSPELVHLHLEARRVRDGLDLSSRVKTRSAGSLLESDATVVCDPRNVLPLRGG